jgi:hypothetical protein
MDHLTSFGIQVNAVFGTRKRLLLFGELSRCDGALTAEDIRADCKRHWGMEVTLVDV